ncbi:ribosome recycling factor [Rhizophagus irregularis]|uniref:Ribosome recycling factor n=3 Tax=Rhizophagus irregularis TaxID=588596 RepID=A0A2I1EFI3_9GLOM|nr:ribosome recycling factor domain-containing protein [Rhizophagus irregularis DAOM 181602=DAOM 197198]EXX50801.1 hypothetical protein RirG_267360 [Rhizophagus irregularis DAOM 197198w]PKC14921.1 ribosome recycling factor [Rhizophagus irregularis]PKC60567.1 ribosome recycling factor [Rhizophagus irregularis]PKY20877.1 ribosome recycling factor [Rhizophagus irregularis]POG60329.1 ribosome recycling factor domain-containing protein [Rhizophagus irregularis DAOM 181602=DAOM 197198]|eukprot:XP_025167195.1 ribosome recycling factor domain-containing protein [Rhizophagus irregularis DAOM 181602=DAOM 197198]
MLSKKFIFTLYNVRPKNPLLYRYGTLSSKPYISNGLLTKHVTVTLQLYQNFFTSQRLLLASKKKPGWKEDSKKGKSYTKDKIEEEEEKNINISEKERNFDLSKVEAKANIVTEKLKKDYSSMRIGRANPAILDPVSVPFKDSSTPLKDIAQIIVKDPQTLLVHVHEEELLKAVDKAIRSANLNLNSVIEGKSIKVPIPKITTEYREKMTKVASKIAESAKIKIRRIREDGMKDLKKDCANRLPRDEAIILTKKLQSLIEKSVKDVDEILKVKSKEISGN